MDTLKLTANAERQWVLERGTKLSLDDLVNKAISRDCTCPISQVSHIKAATALLCKHCCTSCLELPSLDPAPASFFICAITHIIRWTISVLHFAVLGLHCDAVCDVHMKACGDCRSRL